jgi:hypothetical protein
MYFKGGIKPLVVNKTNATTLARAFGKDFEDWVGRRVEIRPETTMYGGKIVPAIRLYPAPPPKQDEPKPRLDDAMSDQIPW